MTHENTILKDQIEFNWSLSSTPSVGIIITHHNYSHMVEKAIDSVLNQTYENLVCILVDDCSNFDHKTKLNKILDRKNDKILKKFKNQNQGQLLAFYDGVKEIDAEFYCLLDPDDEYSPTFIEEMVHIHLNPNCYVPMVCCDQTMCRNGQQITGTLLRNKIIASSNNQFFPQEIKHNCNYYVGPNIYWPWTSSSSMMFRKDALKLLYSENLSRFKRQADSYLGEGCHMLGGTIVYDKALVKRGLHDDNSSRKNHIIAIMETRVKSHMPNRVERQKEHAMANIFDNKGIEYFGRGHFREILKYEFSLPAIYRIRSASKEARKFITLSRFFKLAGAKFMIALRNIFKK